MGDYYGFGNGGNSQPNFSVPPPSFGQKGPGGNFQQQTSQYGAPPQQGSGGGGNWGPARGSDDNSGGYGGYQNRGNNRGPPGGGGSGGSYGNNPRNDYNSDRKNNFSGGSGNKSGFNKGGGNDGDNEMIIQEDTIFVSGMSPHTSEDDIASHFGAIGLIKKDKKTMKPKIWLYRNKETGESKGEATITYDDSNAARSAISWFDNKEFNGAVIHVSLAQRQNNWQKGGNFRGGSRGGGGGGGGPGGRDGGRGGFGGGRDQNSGGPRRDDRRGPQGGSGGGGGGGRNQREGDWTCSGCNNTNFAWRNECNRCKEPKGDSAGGNSGGGGGGGFRQGGSGGGGYDRRPPRDGPMRGGNDRGNDRNRPY